MANRNEPNETAKLTSPFRSTVRPVPQASLVGVVVERIQQMISEHRLSSGDRLPTEAELLDMLGVSRTVLREAINRLEMIGLLTVERGRGMFVGDRSGLDGCLKLIASAVAISPKELSTYNEFREAIECHAARRAAEVASREDIAELESLLARMSPENEDALDGVQADFAFHAKIVELTGNVLLVNSFGVIKEFVMAGILRTVPTEDARDLVDFRSHRKIFTAIRSGDPDAADRAMRQHMKQLNRNLKRVEKQRQKKASETSRAS